MIKITRQAKTPVISKDADTPPSNSPPHAMVFEHRVPDIDFMGTPMHDYEIGSGGFKDVYAGIYSTCLFHIHVLMLTFLLVIGTYRDEVVAIGELRVMALNEFDVKELEVLRCVIFVYA
jgi:hypothetical protein